MSAVFTELDVPSLEMNVGSNLVINAVNLNDDLHIDLKYGLNLSSIELDALYYSVALIYQKDTMATFQVNFFQFSFKIWDHFSAFDPTDNQLTLRISAYNPKFYMPSLSSKKISINIPPQNC